MENSKRKAFTLIELIGVLVIMAILALIATPLVMNIIRKARISADKRSIDAYGRSIDLAIAGYLLDTGKFPTDISQLTIEYSGDEVVCDTTQINPDSSVYLAGCKVKGRSVTNYTYGSDKSPSYKAYNIGDEVSYNNVDYYVIRDSSANEDSVTLLKAEPLITEEVNEYGVGHVNMNVPSTETFYQKAIDLSGYGGVQYYSSSTCGYNGSEWVDSGCTTDYAHSEIKYVVDNWAAVKVPLGLRNARLLTFEDLINDLGYEYYEEGTSSGYRMTESSPKFILAHRPDNKQSYKYWTMSSFSDSSLWVIVLQDQYTIGSNIVHSYNSGAHFYNSAAVRPVIVLDKSVLPNE